MEVVSAELVAEMLPVTPYVKSVEVVAGTVVRVNSIPLYLLLMPL